MGRGFDSRFREIGIVQLVRTIEKSQVRILQSILVRFDGWLSLEHITLKKMYHKENCLVFVSTIRMAKSKAHTGEKPAGIEM